MSEERKLGSQDVYIYVGDQVELSDDAAKALQDLADSMTGDGAEVSGFMMEDELLAAMGGMVMIKLPDVRVTAGPISVATGGCAVDVVLGPKIGN